VQKQSRLLVGAFAILVACSLVATLLLPIVYDAFLEEDEEPGNPEAIDTSVENAIRATAEANPDNPDALAALANYLANTGRLTDAIPIYEQALALAPEEVTIRLDFAQSLIDGDYDGDAELQLLRVVEIDPENARAHFALGELAYNASPRRTNEALDAYERTIEVGADTFVAEQAAERIAELIGGSPSPEAAVG
jgi:cytochrome c-type biogenesis protein CcmH/NrfG